MAQSLIVEGNDAIALTNILIKRKLRPPVGYETETKYKNEFVKTGGGYHGALKALQTELQQASVNNIGLIVDADFGKAGGSWKMIRSILAETFDEQTLQKADSTQGYKIIKSEGLPTVGVWIMPDNDKPGYLEHFLIDLIPQNENQLWQHAQEVIADLQTRPFNELKKISIGKAQLHTWLAWKSEPGKPFGVAVKSNYFDLNTPAVQSFIDWFSATFELS